MIQSGLVIRGLRGVWHWSRALIIGQGWKTLLRHFVRACLICQQDKIKQKKSGEFLELLDRAIQDHGDGFKLLYEFSSPNGHANGEDDEGMTRATDLKMKKWVDERKRHVEFEVGDQVMVKLFPQQFKSLRKVHKGLIRRYEGLLLVIRRVGKEDLGRRMSKRAPTKVVTSYDREVEEIFEASWGSGRLIVAVCGRDQEISQGRHDEDVANLDGGGCHAPPEFPILRESRQEDNRSIGSSRDTVESLAKRVVDVETSMSDLKERVDVSRQHLEELGSDFSEMREDFKSALNGLGGNLGRGILDLSVDVSLCKRFMASGGGNTRNISQKVDVPKPSLFMGKRKAMEQYLEGVNVVDDASKIKMVSRYLKDTTALWWRRR
ncbi:hypothetical protein Tco_1426557, partial [Tanacetum coccineum]